MTKRQDAKAITAILEDAGRDRPDLAWLDKAIRKAGYVPATEVLTAKDVDVAMARIERIMETVATPAEAITGREWRRRVESAFAVAASGE